ncbi:MAG TPA: SIR2 family protein [Candidatus Binatia bacterium]|jgi:hypothetical protein
MLTVIFGAGASYDSAASYPPGTTPGSDARLPLADQLFDDREHFANAMQRFPDCSPIVTFLRHRNQDLPVERVLEHLQAGAKKHSQGQREIVAVLYYLQAMIWECQKRWENIHKGVTNYKALLYLIRQLRNYSTPVSLVTFNYDTMLEDALATVETTIESMSDYVHSSDYKVFKIHGSINWGRVLGDVPPLREIHTLQDNQIPAEVIRLAPQIIVGRLITDQFTNQHQLTVRKYSGKALFPAIAIPVENKLDFECPPEHIETLKKCLPQTRKLLVIGWRATDAPFVELLSKNLPDHILVQTVCGSEIEGKKVGERLRDAGINHGGIFTAYNHGFSSFVCTAEARKFLGMGIE